MENREIELRLLAQTIYEIRLLLSHHLGSTNKATESEAIAAHLAYALHNQALSIIENRKQEFNIESARESLMAVSKMYNQNQLALTFERILSGEHS